MRLACAFLALLLPHYGSAGSSDPQEEIRTGALSIVYWPGQEVAAAALSKAIGGQPHLPGLPDTILAGAAVLIYLAPSEAVFDSLAPGVADWSGGIAFPQGDVIVLPTFAPRAGGLPLATVARHELAHVALGRYLGASVPRWFQEGYAQLASGSWGAGNAWTLRFAILAGRLPSLESLTLDFKAKRLSAQHAYLLSYTAVEYLRRLGGAVGFARLLDRWHETGSLDSAIRRTYGITLARFESMWRKDVASRFGWLLVTAQTAVYWTALTIVLLVLGYWKKRRDRRRLAALEAVSRAASPPEGEQTSDSGEQGYICDMIDGGPPSG